MKVWKGDWQARVLERVRALGFESLSEFVGAHPAATYVQLAQMLDPVPVAAVQVEQLALAEAERNLKMDEFARGSLVRAMRARMPDGWGVGERWEYRRARSCASWAGALGPEFEELIFDVWNRLSAEAPVGWLPQRPDDPLILAAFNGRSFEKQS